MLQLVVDPAFPEADRLVAPLAITTATALPVMLDQFEDDALDRTWSGALCHNRDMSVLRTSVNTSK